MSYLIAGFMTKNQYNYSIIAVINIPNQKIILYIVKTYEKISQVFSHSQLNAIILYKLLVEKAL